MSSSGIAVAIIREEDPATLSMLQIDAIGSTAAAQRYLQRQRDDSIMIYLSVSGSSVVPFRVLDSDSIASVKLRIQACKGFVVKKQRLVFDGRELARDDCLVRDYGIGDGNVLHLVLRFSDLRAITVKTTCGRTFEFHVDATQNVRYVKRQIAKKGKGFANLNDQKLICDGEELEDQRPIHDISRNREYAVIHLVVHKSAKVRTKPVDKDFELSINAPTDDDDDDAVVTNKVGSGDGDVVVVGLVDGQRPQLTQTAAAAAAAAAAKGRQLPPPQRDFCLEPVFGNPKIVVSPVIKDLLHAAFSGLDKGHTPVRSPDGSGGAYFMQDAAGQEYVAVFKPIDEEPLAVNNPQGLPVSPDGEGLKRGTRVGEGAFREVAAYILDHPMAGGPKPLSSYDSVGFAGVPPTVMIRCLHEGFNHPQGYYGHVKLGSLQMFIKNNGTCEDIGPRAFPVEEVHKISVLDIRLANTDRHAGNILVCKQDAQGPNVLVPIDHGYCLPENFEDCTFEWLYWPQAREPYNSETEQYIKSLDAEKDIALLKFHGWDLSVECARTLRISTMLLKKGVERKLTPFAIGSILCRETIKKKSLIEEIIHEAEEEAVLPGSSEVVFLETVSEIMDRRLDELMA